MLRRTLPCLHADSCKPLQNPQSPIGACPNVCPCACERSAVFTAPRVLHRPCSGFYTAAFQNPAVSLASKISHANYLWPRLHTAGATSRMGDVSALTHKYAG